MGLKGTNYNFTGQQKVYKGKVRDVYFLENDILVMATKKQKVYTFAKKKQTTLSLHL